MKRLVKIGAILAIMLVTFPVAAQNSKFYKGVFEKTTPTSVITANIDFYGKSIESMDGEKCYGTIEVATERGVTGYDIVAIHSIDLEGAEPSIDIVPWQFPDSVIKLSFAGFPSSRTIWFEDWDAPRETFNDVTLKKK